jgi:alpha-mannosidase
MAFPFFTIERIETVFAALEQLRYKNRITIDRFDSYSGDDGATVNFSPASIPSPDGVFEKGQLWSGRDAYLWLTGTLSFPSEWKGRDVLAYFDFGKTGGGNSSGFEALLYVDGQPYQGVDSNHREVFFDTAKTGSTADIALRLWSGLEGGGCPVMQQHQFKDAFIACLDKACDDLWYLSKNCIETIRVLDPDSSIRTDIEQALTQAFRITDFTNPGSGECYDSIAAADELLNKMLKAMPRNNDVVVSCVGHSHIDMAWLWRMKHTHEKGARTFSTVNRLMERYPEYIFMHTSAQLYDFIKTDFPEIYGEIQQRVKEKRWEPSGGMWVEADCNITGGESLVRQILYGKRFFKKEFGYENTFLWLPDVFGYNAALPQILRKSGIDTFVTTKISWNEVDMMPYDTFAWRGIDGSDVLTHFITTPDVYDTTKFYTYNGNILPKTVAGIWKKYKNKDLTKNLLLCYGWGDGGGGVDRSMLENIRQIEKIPGLPQIRTSNVTSYLEKLHKSWDDKANTAYRPVWDGEMYLEFHRGTYTSQARNKKANREMELAFRTAEMLQSFAAAVSGRWDAYDTAAFARGWKLILCNQFHDIIPGSSIHEVYEDCKKEYGETAEIASVLTENALLALVISGAENVYSVFNNASWKTTGIVNLPQTDLESFHVEDGNGKIIPCQNTADGEIRAALKDMEPLSFTSLHVVPGKAGTAEISFSVTGTTVETPWYTLTWNNTGSIDRIFDKQAGREVLAAEGNVLEMFEDKPRQFDAWEVEATIDLKKEIVNAFRGATVIENGPCCIRIRFVWSYNKSSVTQDLVLYADTKRIDFKTTVDWHERNKLLKVAFPVNVRATKALYDIQFGSIERSVHQNTSWDFAKFEVSAHQWADLSEHGFGVALMNDCKYGYDIKQNIMRLSLLKSAEYPDPSSDEGLQKFTYSLFVHDKEWYDAGIVQSAWNLNNPLSSVKGCAAEKCKSMLTLHSDYIALDAFKKTEDGNRVLLRFHEYAGGMSALDCTFNAHASYWYEADLMENAVGEKHSGGHITAQLHPFEIYTVIIELK